MVDGIIFSTDNKMIGFGRNYGPYIIANALRKIGLKIQVVEFFEYLTKNDIQNIADKFIDGNTLFVGFSSTHFCSMDPYLDTLFGKPSKYFPRSDDFMNIFFKILDKKNPNLKYIYGGINTENTRREYPKIDYWVLDEAEYVIKKLVNYQIKRNMKIFCNVIDCSSMLPVDFHKVPMCWQPEDNLFQDEHLPLEIERGCPFHCAFCKHKHIRYNPNVKSIDTLKDEVTRNYELYGIKNYMLTDSTFNSTLKKTVDVCNMFSKLSFKIKFVTFARLKGFIDNPETGHMMLDAGAEGLAFGVESLTPKTLKYIKKGPHPDIQLETLNNLRKIWSGKIHISACFIAGLPYDNEDDIKKWYKYCKGEKSPFDVVTIRPLYIPVRDSIKREAPLTMNPGKWGYTLLSDGYWVSETSDMTFKKAARVCEELKYDHIHIGHTYYNRLRNLGFIADETWSMDHRNYTDEIKKRKRNLKEDYIRKLLT